MDADDFRAAVEADARTELDRLGSNKYLLAVTGADLDVEAVLASALAAERAAKQRFADWAADADGDAVRETFEAAAAREADHRDRVASELDAVDGADPDYDGSGAFAGALDACDGPIERVAAGLVARSLVGLRTGTQYVSFFINEADERRADLFRGFERDTAEQLETGLDLLAALCSDDSDRERARAAAVEAIEAAYADYEAALEGLGVDPKPVC